MSPGACRVVSTIPGHPGAGAVAGRLLRSATLNCNHKECPGLFSSHHPTLPRRCGSWPRASRCSDVRRNINSLAAGVTADGSAFIRTSWSTGDGNSVTYIEYYDDYTCLHYDLIYDLLYDTIRTPTNAAFIMYRFP